MSVEHSRPKTTPRLNRDEMHDTYGVYTYSDDNVTVISQPGFVDTIDAIRDQPARGTTIVTPELALLDDSELMDFSRERQQTPEMVNLLMHRFLALKEATYDSDNIVMMGAPLRARATSGSNNGMLALHNGSVVHEQRKRYPGMYEQSLDQFDFKDKPNTYHRLGATAVICSELMFALHLEPHIKQNTERIMMPAAWGVPSMTPEAIARHGSIDQYNQYTLNAAVEMATEDLPNLKKVYVADRPMGGNKPQVGRITIDR